MYILYNNDGSINKFDLSDFIQKGNNGVNYIFLAIKGYDYHQWSAAVLFTLPNDEVEVITPLAGQQEIDGTQYSGWFVVIPASVTVFVGNVKFSVQVLNLQDQVLFTYQGTLVVNPSSIVPDETKITLSQYNALLQLVIQTPTALTTIKVLNNPLLEDLSAYSEGQIFLSRSDGKFYILQGGIIRLFALDYVTSDALSQALSGYVTSQALSTALSSYVTTAALNSTLSSYITSTNLTSILSNYVTSSSLISTLSDYVTSNALDSKLGEYVKSSTLSSTLASYVTSSSLASTLSNYVTSNGLTSILSGYVTSAYLSTVLAGYLTSSDLNGYATESFVNSALSNYITSSDLSTALNDYATQTWVNNNLSSYVTSTALSNTLANYVTSTQMQNAIATALSSALEYKGKASVSTLNGYGTSSSNGSLYVLTDAGTLTQGNVSVIAGDQVAWNSSTAQWDKLAAAIDTSNFVTTSDLNTALGDYVLTSALSSALANYVTSSSLSSTLASYVTSTALSSALASYVTTTALNTALSSYVTTTALNTALSDYVTTSDLNTAIADFITSNDLSTALASYVTASSLASTLASYVTSSSLASTLSSYVTTSALASALTSYVTSSTLASTLAGYVQAEAGKGLSSNDYTTADQTKLSGIESGAQVNVLEGISINGVILPISGKIASITGLATTSYVDDKVNRLEPLNVGSLSVYQFLQTYGVGTYVNSSITFSVTGPVSTFMKIHSWYHIIYSNVGYVELKIELYYNGATLIVSYQKQITGNWQDNASELTDTLTNIVSKGMGGSVTISGTVYRYNQIGSAIYKHVLHISHANTRDYVSRRKISIDSVGGGIGYGPLDTPSDGIYIEVITRLATSITNLNNLKSAILSYHGKVTHAYTNSGFPMANPNLNVMASSSTGYKFQLVLTEISGTEKVDNLYYLSRSSDITLFSDTITLLGYETTRN